MPKNPATESELKLRGQFKPSRHSGRGERPVVGGVPIRPKDLSGEAGALWGRVVPTLVAAGILRAVDTSLVVAACNEWSNYVAAQEKLESDPLDGPTRRAATSHLRGFMAVAELIGLSPASRQRLRVKPTDEKPKLSVTGFARSRK